MLLTFDDTASRHVAPAAVVIYRGDVVPRGGTVNSAHFGSRGLRAARRKAPTACAFNSSITCRGHGLSRTLRRRPFACERITLDRLINKSVESRCVELNRE